MYAVHKGFNAMMFVRAMTVLVLAVGAVLWACYLIFGEVRYKHYFFQFLKVTLYLTVISGIGVLIYQLFLSH